MATERELNILIKAKDMASKVLGKYEDQFNQIGKSLLAVGAAGVTGIGAAVKVAADFEQGMSRVGALSNATDDELRILTKTAKDLGASTAFSAKEASDGMSALAMAGFDVNEIVGAMPGLLDTAAAGQMDLGRTADIVSNVLSGFQISAEETGRVADVMAKTFTSSNTDLQMLGETFKYIGPVASSAGYSLEEMAAATGLLGNAGIQGSQAGTALRAMMLKLSAPTEGAAKQLKALGISVREADGSMKSMPDILAEFEKGLSKVDKETRDAALQTIMGTEAMSGFQALLNEGSDTLRDYAGELENAGGTAGDIAAKQLDNLNGAITILKSALSGAAIEIGSVFIPYIRMLAEFITGLLSAFNNLDPSIQRKIALFAAAGSAMALLTGGILVLIPMLPALGAMFSALLGPVGLVIAIIAALAFVIYKNFDEILAFVRNNSDQLKAFLLATWTNIQEIISFALAFIQEMIQIYGEGFLSTIRGIFESIWSVISVIMSTVSTLLQMIWSYISELIETHGHAIMSSVMAAFDGVQKAISVAAEIITSIIEWAFPYIQDIIHFVLSDVIPWTIGMFNQIADFIGDVMPKIVQVIQWAWERVIKPIVTGVMNGLVPLIKSAWSMISGIISGALKIIMGIVKTVLSVLTGDWSGAWEGIKQIVSGIFETIKSIIGGGFDFVVKIFNGLLETLAGLGSSFYNIGIDLIKGLINGIKNMASSAATAAVDAVKGAIDGAKKFLGIKSPSRLMMEIGAFTTEGFADGITGAIRMAQKASEKMAGAAIKPVNDIQVDPAALTGKTRSSNAAVNNQSNGSHFNGQSFDARALAQEIAKSLAPLFMDLGKKFRLNRDESPIVMMDGQIVGRIVKRYIDREKTRIGDDV